MPLSDAEVQFPFFERSIRILVVEDEFCIADLYSQHLTANKLYGVECVSCAREAARKLSSSNRYHVCLLDLGITDINDDEYYLVKKYSSRTSFIVVSGRESLEKGFQSAAIGVFAVVDKPIDFHAEDIYSQINEAFLLSLVSPDDAVNCKPVIKKAIDVFVSLQPRTLAQWADKVAVGERYLRKVLRSCSGYQPKHLLWLRRAYSCAFSHYQPQPHEKFGLERASMGRFKEINDDDCEKFQRFYIKHKDLIDRILQRR